MQFWNSSSLLSFMTITFVIVSLFFSSYGYGETDVFRTNQAEYQQLLAAGEYGQLEKIERRLRKDLDPDWSGTPELSYFVFALARNGLESREEILERRVLIYRWVESSNSEISKVVMFAFEYGYAWHLRGDDFVYHTMEGRVESFRSHLDNVENLAQELTTDLGEHPVFLRYRLELGLSASWPRDKFEKSYQEAIAMYPDFLLLHAVRARYYLPRWHGTPSRFSQVLDEMERDYYQYYGDRMYALLQYANRRGNMYENGEVDWDRFRKSFEAVVAKFPEREARVKFAIEACLAEEWSDLKILLGQIDPAPNGEEWSSDYYRYCSRSSELFDGSRTIAEILLSTPEILVPSEPVSDDPIDQPESDRQLLESVSGSDTQYASVAETVHELAARNPNIFSLMDELGIQLTAQDTYKAIVEISKYDPEAAIGIVHRLENLGYADKARKLLKRSLRFSGEGYLPMLAKFPILWEPGDIAQLELPPEDMFKLLSEKENFSNYHFVLQMEAVQEFYFDNPELVLEYLRQQPRGSKHQLTSSVRNMLVEIDYSEAVKFDLLLDPTGKEVKSSLWRIVEDGGDPFAVIDEMEIVVQEDQLYPVLQRLAYKDPKLASRYLSRIPQNRDRLRRRVLDHYKKRYKNEYDVWLQKNFEWITDAQFRVMILDDVFGAIEFANGVEDESVRDHLLEIAGDPGPNIPVDEALDSIELPESRFEKDKIKTLNYVVMRDPAIALDWFEQNVHSISPNTLSIVVQLTYIFIEFDVFSWLQKMPDYESLDADRITVYKFYSVNAPNIVASWIAEKEVVGVEEKYFLLAKQWLSNDKNAALVWIESVDEVLSDSHLAELARALIDANETEKAGEIIEGIRDGELKGSLLAEFEGQIKVSE